MAITLIDEPIQFEPILKPRVWGGQTLAKFGKRLPPGQSIGESWELADLPESIADGRSVIASPSSLAGRTLRAVLRDDELRESLMGDAPLSAEGGFPLLIKFLDARDNLSVQVHPSIEYARAHPEAHIKSEAWVVLHAEPGAVIYKGLKSGVDRQQVERGVRTGEIVNLLNAIEVQPGDCHYLPTGECHALGAGIVVAEVQTPSDTTFRLYDWGRPAGDGRRLHVAEALECMGIDGPHNPSSFPKPHRVNSTDGVTTTLLTTTEYFQIERVDAREGSDFELVTNGVPMILMAISGTGRVHGEAKAGVPFAAGATLLIPASARAWRVECMTSASLLLVRVPSPLRNMLA